MLEKLYEIERKYDEYTELLSDPEIISNQGEWQKYARAQAGMTNLVTTFREYQEVLRELEETEILLLEKLDSDMQEMAEQERDKLKKVSQELEEQIQVLLLPKDPLDEKNVIMEIRAGAGGDEAALFAGDLYKMYTRYAEGKGWKTELLSVSYSDQGGYKEIIFLVEGHGAYSKLKFESGVHRVQRIPATESAGRIHTSTATVAVLPEAEEVEVSINPNDLRIDVYCSSGPGGQCVNTTQSAVRVTHLPTGIIATCQDEKSQLKNKEKALRVLRARILEKAQDEASGEQASQRRSQVGTGDRSERIRTFNFPQGRVTDHRIGLTLHRLESVLNGDLEEMIEALNSSDQAERLKAEIE